MSSYAFTPASTYGTTRGGGVSSMTADSTSGASTIASAEAAMQSGWNSVLWDNPLFWLVLVALIFMGYIFFGFNVGVKRIGDAKVQVGS